MHWEIESNSKTEDCGGASSAKVDTSSSNADFRSGQRDRIRFLFHFRPLMDSLWIFFTDMLESWDLLGISPSFLRGFLWIPSESISCEIHQRML